jgi:predicted kinase
MAGDGALDLVVVSGVPAAGKTTTARRLAVDLGAPLLWRGGLRRAVLEPIALSVPAVAEQIPAAADRLVSAAVETAVAGGTVVLDANLHNTRQREALRALVEGRGLHCFEVFLRGDPATLLERLDARADPPLTVELRGYVEDVYASALGPALDGIAPAAVIDTTGFDDFDVHYAHVLTGIAPRVAPRPDARARAAVVLISGLPAAGKSTLGRRIARDLGCSLVWRDGLRRSVLAGLGGPDADISSCIPAASDALVLGVLQPLLSARRTVVLDGNFNNAIQAKAVAEFLARVPSVRTFEVCLWGDEEVLRERFIARADPPLTEELRPYFDAVIRRERIPVLPASTPRIEIDTTDLTSVDQVYGQLIEKVRAHVNA